ncbi:GTPase domain-containing protein [Saccharibacillus sacchari]|uniref:GTPase domain-containing protein n=1 Tax=Saccharibacillus sacchari TaxID=456493 RepID=UPI0004B08CF5|nr:GTPase domain-containing protein [Saccharibacillus sacchari]
MDNITSKDKMKQRRSRFRMQENAPTITVSGPSGSGKSYLLTVLLPETSNKLLAWNVGMKQTTLINTKLMLDSTMNQDEAVIRVKMRPFDIMLIKPIMHKMILDVIFENRDELDGLELDEDIVYKVLNPRNRAYHFAEFVQKHSDKQGCPDQKLLLQLLQRFFEGLIPEIQEAVKEKEKGTKTVYPKPKKKEIYEMVIQERLGDSEVQGLESEVYTWFMQLYSFIKGEILKTCEFLDSEQVYAVVEDRVESDSIKNLIQDTYNVDSPYSLIIEELSYCVQPSIPFAMAFKEAYREDAKLGKVLRLNILDTPGLTQTGETKEDMQEVLQQVMGHQSDAYLFLCSTDERPTVYENMKELLIKRREKFQEIPIKLLRTKVDLNLYELMKKDHLMEVGRPEFTDTEAFFYAEKAYEKFTQAIDAENVELSESLGVYNPLDFISLDFTPLRNLAGSFFEKKPTIEKEKLFHILFDLSRKVHDAHMPSYVGRRYLQMKELDEAALVIKMNKEMGQLLEDFAVHMKVMNSREYQGNYYQFESKKKLYHGHSVYTGLKKARIGEGHETRATVYENFNIHVRSMIQKWTTAFIQNRPISFDVSFENIRDSEAKRLAEIEAPQVLKDIFRQQLSQILYRISKALSYDGMKTEIEDIYAKQAPDQAFRNNMRLFYAKFSDEMYWKEGLSRFLQQELNQLLSKMYFYE